MNDPNEEQVNWADVDEAAQEQTYEQIKEEIKELDTSNGW